MIKVRVINSILEEQQYLEDAKFAVGEYISPVDSEEAVKYFTDAFTKQHPSIKISMKPQAISDFLKKEFRIVSIIIDDGKYSYYCTVEDSYVMYLIPEKYCQFVY